MGYRRRASSQTNLLASRRNDCKFSSPKSDEIFLSYNRDRVDDMGKNLGHFSHPNDSYRPNGSHFKSDQPFIGASFVYPA